MRLLTFISLILLTSCTNNFKKFYKEEELYKSSKDKITFYQGDPSIIVSEEIRQELEKYFRKGYIVIGSSQFNSGEETDPEREIKKLSKKLGAEIILWNYKYTNTVSGVNTYSYYTPQTDTSFYRGNISNSYSINSYNYSGNITTQTQRQNIASVPYSIRRYDYEAVFLGKRNIKAKLGAFYKDLDREQRISQKIKGGVKIEMILEDTPIHRSSLLEGDVMTRIQNHDITTSEDLYNFIQDGLDLSKNIDISYIRDGKVGKEVIKAAK
jgi:hypothetical protein